VASLRFTSAFENVDEDGIAPGLSEAAAADATASSAYVTAPDGLGRVKEVE